MNWDPTLLMLSLLPSGAGFALFLYGRKQRRWPQLVGGLVLMVYPYFVASVTALVAVGLVVGAGLYFLIAAGR